MFQLVSCPVTRNIQEASGHLHLSLQEAITLPVWFLVASDTNLPCSQPLRAGGSWDGTQSSSVHAWGTGHISRPAREWRPWWAQERGSCITDTGLPTSEEGPLQLPGSQHSPGVSLAPGGSGGSDLQLSMLRLSPC